MVSDDRHKKLQRNQSMFKYPLEQCDVTDKEKLKEFRGKRQQWVEWLKGEDIHSIWKQINQHFWDISLFCTINELRKIAAKSLKPEVGFNSSVLRLFDLGFVISQSTAIRRLIEKPLSSPNRAVISLRRIIYEVKEYRHLLTRENYVAFDGLPFDSTPKCIPEPQSGALSVRTGWIASDGPNAWLTSRLVHQNFDRLSKVGAKQRQRNDLIDEEWFEYLDNKLEICGDVKKYVDKFIAHGADPVTRQGLTEEQEGITLMRLESCWKAIYQTAAFIYGPLLWEGSYGSLPIPQFDHLENLDKRWVDPGNVVKAHKKWNQYSKKIEKWEQESLWPAGTDLIK